MQGFPTFGVNQPTTVAVPQAAASPSLGLLSPAAPGTYPQGLPMGGPPPIAPMPGPAALGPGTPQGSVGVAGIAGVGINPVPVVSPPAVTGGPHPLPSLPPCPLPQGFPNPFEAGSPVGNRPPATALPPFSPGTTTVVGPQGPLPGLGHIGLPTAGASQQARPAPGVTPAPHAPTAVPAPQPSPFWTALAWQLLSAPSVRAVVGVDLKGLMEGEARARLIQLATTLLLSPEMQSAFRAMASGSLLQTPFSALFAERLAAALAGGGLLRSGTSA